MFSVKVTNEAGELIGGLATWTWGGLCGIELLWVREGNRRDGWGGRILRASEAEAQRRGCDRVAVSSFTFQAPDFYQRHGFVVNPRCGRCRRSTAAGSDVAGVALALDERATISAAAVVEGGG